MTWIPKNCVFEWKGVVVIVNIRFQYHKIVFHTSMLFVRIEIVFLMPVSICPCNENTVLVVSGFLVRRCAMHTCRTFPVNLSSIVPLRSFITLNQRPSHYNENQIKMMLKLFAVLCLAGKYNEFTSSLALSVEGLFYIVRRFRENC